MTGTPFLAYEIAADNVSGALVGAGSLILPRIAAFHPQQDDGDPEPGFRALAELSFLAQSAGTPAAPASPARVRVRFPAGPRSEVIDADVLYATTDDDEPFALAFLDRRSRNPYTFVTSGADDDAVRGLLSLYAAAPVALEPADRSRRAPRPPRAVAVPNRVDDFLATESFLPTKDGGWNGQIPPGLGPLIELYRQLAASICDYIKCNRWPCTLFC